MRNVVVIGVGNLGIRHLQAIMEYKNSFNLYAVDNSEESIEKINDFFKSYEKNDRINFKIMNNFMNLPDGIDVAIIGTPSNIRAQIIRELLKYKNVKYLILEKVLFQNIEDYYEIDLLLKNNNVKAWVNCPRRMMSGHKKIKEIFSNDQISQVIISGGNWGLGCNSIHMLDLIEFFIGEFKDLNCNGKMIDEKIIPSKRDRFLEFTGSLIGKINDTSFIISSYADSSEPITMYFFGEKNSVIIKENEQKAFNIIGDFVENLSIPILYQSQLTDKVVEQLFNTGNCELTPYEISSKLHIPMLKVFIDHQNKFGKGDKKSCLIT